MLLSAALTLPVFLLPQEAEPEFVRPTMDRVTVYSGQAMVEKTCAVDSRTEGARTVLIGPFPLTAESSSFQVKVVGGRAVVEGLEVRTETGIALDTATRDALRLQLEDLRKERRELDSQLASINTGRSFVESVLASLASGQGAGGVLEAASVENLDPLFRFVRERSQELDQAMASYEWEASRIEKRIAQVESQLGEAEQDRLRRYLQARVVLNFERAGEALLRVTYLTTGATWRPNYDVRVSPDLTGVNVALVAQVTQQTGEDWENADVMLSTSTPHAGLTPPRLPNRLYDLRQFRNLGQPDPAPSKDDNVLQLEYAGAGPEARANLGPFPPGPFAGVQDFGLTTQFVLPERKNVHSNGEAHRFLLREVPLSVRPERFVVPSMSNIAYLRAEITLVGDAPLLQGGAKVFLGPDFLGETHFPTLRPGDRTVINLGIDPNLSCNWETIIDQRDDPGLLESQVEITRVFRATLTLSAGAPAPVDVLIEDGMPVSRDDEIEIRPTEIYPRAMQDDESKRLREERGRLRWRLRLSPGQSQVLRWGYVVAFDEDLDPVLIEQ